MNGNTHISSLKPSLKPTNLCAQGCKGSGRESLRYNLGAAKEDREERGLGGREKERVEGVTRHP